MNAASVPLAASLSIAWCSLATLASGDVVKVPDPANNIFTLQDGLDAAQANDVVSIAPGSYPGRFTITGKAGVKIRGAGGKNGNAIILDVRDGAGSALGEGLVIDDCDGARVESITVQHAAVNGAFKGVGIAVKQSNGVTLEDVTVLDCEEEGLELTGDDATLLRCEFAGNGGGVKITGERATLTDVIARNDRIRGIAVFGNSATTKRCTARAIQGGGGISITGDQPTVVDCAVAAIVDAGFNAITTTGASPLIKDNRVTGSSIGIFVVYGAFGTIRDNLVEDCNDSGIRIGDVSHDLTLKNNVVRRCGSPTSAAYLIDGVGEQLKDNRAEDCAGDGFQLVGTDATLVGNEARRCLRDGFDIGPTAERAVLVGNVAKENRAEGIENSAPNVLLTGNSAKKNRLDFGNDGTITAQSSGNDFAIAGAPAPQLD